MPARAPLCVPDAGALLLIREAASTPDFASIYQTWFRKVYGWTRALGGADADLEDLTQEVFVVVQRKLSSFNGDNTAGWLYRIATRTVSDYRRRNWFKHLLHRPRHVELDRFSHQGRSPSELLENREAASLLGQLLERMSSKRRTAFILFEIEGYSGEEIAQLEDVPVATVWTRLHHARKEFLELVAELEREGQR